MHPLTKFKFCPVCGSARFEENNEKSKKCHDCGFVYYFNPVAASVAFIVNGERQLLVCRRAKDPVKGTLDLPGGFIDCFETGEEGILREIAEEVGVSVSRPQFLFSLPNTYLYSDFLVHTLDAFYLCHTTDTAPALAMDDVAESQWVDFDKINPAEFGLTSIRKGVEWFKENVLNGTICSDDRK